MEADLGDGIVSSKKAYRKEKQKDRHSESMPEDEEPDFSDPESFVDNISDADLLGDYLKSKPKETDGIDSVIVIDNVPQVGPDRVEKLLNIIRKICSKFGKIVNEFFPTENGTTKGYIFLEFQNPQEAHEAVKAINGHKLDKQHTFAVNLFSDFDKYANIPEKWDAPTPQPFKDHGNLYHWLTNQHCYDQFSVIYEQGDKTAIYQSTGSEPVQVETRDRWTETYVQWSPRGSYLLTFHQKGVALWGGEHMKQIMRFSHPGVQLSSFSPCERYLVTFSPLPDNNDDPQAIIIWDVLTGLKKRGFHCENASAWPIFKWSNDGKFFARMSQDALSIYETPSFGLLDKKSIKIKLLKDFAWSPTDNIISYWTAEERDTPARVTLIEIPSRQTLCVKNLFTVADCKMHWQKSGQYLCVKVDRYKSKKDDKYAGIYHNFNIFRLKEKEIPVDTVEVKDSISAFAWEPVGHRFAVIHGDAPRINVSFYNVKTGATVELIMDGIEEKMVSTVSEKVLRDGVKCCMVAAQYKEVWRTMHSMPTSKTLEKRTVNSLFWSPAGQFIVLAGLRSMNGVLEFVDTNDMTIMMQAEHFMATDVEWDPTGRYVATAVSWWGHKVDNAYWLWNFQGKLLHKQQLEKFCQLLWRPRPPTLLSAEQIKDVKKNMKTYYNNKFSIEDKMRESKASKEQIEKRRTQMEDFEAWRKKCDERYSSERMRRIGLRNGVDADNPTDASNEFCAEETVEFLIEVEEIIIDEE